MYQYCPYPESKVEWLSDKTGFKISAPWVSVDVVVDTDSVERIQALANPISSELLTSFTDFPLGYIKPRESLFGAAFSERGLAIDTNLSPSELAARVWQSHRDELPKNWSWDSDKILKDSQIPNSDAYDPLSVYGLLQRERLCQEVSGDGANHLFELLDVLRQKSEVRFFDAVSEVLRQTFEVTWACTSSLEPALENYAPARDAVAAFIRAERGHDELVRDSLAKLGINDPFQIPALDSTRLSMALLKFSAENYFLAFCCAVGYFEGSGYTQEDPIAALLRKTSRPEAALGIERHFHINKSQMHSAIGHEFAQKLGPVDAATVIAAVRLTELLTTAGSRVSRELSEKVRSFI